MRDKKVWLITGAGRDQLNARPLTPARPAPRAGGARRLPSAVHPEKTDNTYDTETGRHRRARHRRKQRYRRRHTRPRHTAIGELWIMPTDQV